MTRTLQAMLVDTNSCTKINCKVELLWSYLRYMYSTVFYLFMHKNYILRCITYCIIWNTRVYIFQLSG